ncbi:MULTISPECIES: outer membrane lipoprotein [Giesbergeria]|uniref:Glycine zipper 2TM domain-containing protein n=1 Tax=Giesbergeria sinuosa TaxID=80883 RepID=A0ABV9QF85_9BURK
MPSFLRCTTGAVSVIACAVLTACATQQPAPQPVYASSGAYQSRPAAAPRGTEYAHVTRIDVLQSHQRQTSGAGAVAGAVIGGVLGNQIGHGGGRAVATAAGVVGGAVVGNAIEERSGGGGYARSYRITLRMDRGGSRSYDVPSPGDLRTGDRVRVYQGQISRY